MDKVTHLTDGILDQQGVDGDVEDEFPHPGVRVEESDVLFHNYFQVLPSKHTHQPFSSIHPTHDLSVRGQAHNEAEIDEVESIIEDLIHNLVKICLVLVKFIDVIAK